jgi:hypothetical protein
MQATIRTVVNQVRCSVIMNDMVIIAAHDVDGQASHDELTVHGEYDVKT